jgi:methionyl-tRNA formyltransferase
MMKFVYFGTPVFARIILDELESAGYSPLAVVTQPAKPKGRGLTLTPSDIERWATEKGIEVLTPNVVRGNSLFIERLRSYSADCFIVAAYGKILPKEILALPRRGTVNVHPSLLPKYRGSSPIETQILEGEREIGVSIMVMDEEVDHGPVLASDSIPLPEDDPPRCDELTELLAHKGGALLSKILPGLMSGTLTPVPQEHSKATFTKKIAKEDGNIDLSGDPAVNLRKIRAYRNWPGAFATLERRGKPLRVKITEARIENGKLVIERIIPDGKREMHYGDFLRG